MGLIRVSSITAIGTFTALSPATPDWLRLVPGRCTGLADADLRTDVEDAPGQDGALVFAPLDGQQPITLGGDLIITSDGSDPGYMEAAETLFAVLQTALAALKAAPDDLTWPTGSMSVWKNGKLEPTFDENSKLTAVTFGLIVDNGL